MFKCLASVYLETQQNIRSGAESTGQPTYLHVHLRQLFHFRCFRCFLSLFLSFIISFFIMYIEEIFRQLYIGLADWDDHTIDIDHTVPACQPCTNITALQRSSYVHASPYVKSHVNLQVIRLTQTHNYIE